MCVLCQINQKPTPLLFLFGPPISLDNRFNIYQGSILPLKNFTPFICRTFFVTVQIKITLSGLLHETFFIGQNIHFLTVKNVVKLSLKHLPEGQKYTGGKKVQ